MLVRSFPILVLLLFLALDLAARPHAVQGVSWQPWNLTNALTFALVARFGWKWLILAFVATAIAELLEFGSGGLPSALVEAAATGLWAVALRRRGRGVIRLERPRAVFALFAAACGVAVTLATARVLPVILGTGLGPSDLLAVFARIALANSGAILALAPFILLVPLRRPGFVGPREALEAALQGILLGAIALEVFGRFVNEEIHFFYLLFLPISWIAVRHGLLGVSSALAALALAPLASDTVHGHHDLPIIELQIRLLVLAVTSLLLGAMVSERRSSEARLIARQAELAHFQRLNVGAEMASALAHELNQPLTAAMNYVQAGLRLIRAPAPDLERAAQVVEKGLDQIERMGDTIHGLREFMRKGELNRSHNDVREMADEALRLTAAEANAAGIAIAVLCPSGLAPVLVDRTQIVQVLVNLIRNAVQALAGYSRENPAIRVEARAGGGSIEVLVADNGPGLADDVLSRLFTPFVTTKVSGMGLGLSISKSIVEAQGGRLTAENQPGGGAAFRFTLPVAIVEKSSG